MSDVRRIARQLQRTFEGPAFHGPAVEEALAGVTAEVAARRPAGGSHNVWQIVRHIAVWQDTVSRWLEGDRTRPTDEEDWSQASETSEAAWQEALVALRRSNQTLCERVTALAESRLDEPIYEGMPKVYVALHGIVHHNVYHAGQIALLKKLL